jgi:hypothetical protein
VGVLALSPADFGKLLADATEKVGQGDPGRQRQAGVIRLAQVTDRPDGGACVRDRVSIREFDENKVDVLWAAR